MLKGTEKLNFKFPISLKPFVWDGTNLQRLISIHTAKLLNFRILVLHNGIFARNPINLSCSSAQYWDESVIP